MGVRGMLVTGGLVALALASHAAAQRPDAAHWARYAGAREVQIRDVAAVIVITPENRADVAIAIENSGPLSAPEVRLSGRRLILDGRLRGQIRSCHAQVEAFTVTTRRRGRLQTSQLPTIRVRAPQDAVIAAGGAYVLRLAPSQSAHLNFGGCGFAAVARVEDEAEVRVGGNVNVQIEEAGELSLASAGASDIAVGVVRDGFTLSVAGSSDVSVVRADGPTSIAVQGSGDVEIAGGRATSLSIAVAGSGDVRHQGSARELDAVVVGSGDVSVRSVDGEISRRVIGSGEVRTGGP